MPHLLLKKLEKGLTCNIFSLLVFFDDHVKNIILYEFDVRYVKD